MKQVREMEGIPELDKQEELKPSLKSFKMNGSMIEPVRPSADDVKN